MADRSYTALFPFCGIGGGALGFTHDAVRLLGTDARFRSLGGIDCDADACRNFERLTKSPALHADVATMTPAQLRAFAGDDAPDVVFMSPPCKGYSGLLGQKRSEQPKYTALNQLALDCIELVLAAWARPPRLILLENVPRIATRGAALLRKVRSLLHRAGYVSHGSSHDCGELGGLAQHRRRFLLVARHTAQVASLLYQPMKRRVRGCGEVLGELPLPNDPAAGPLHTLPGISMLNWIRLALIPPGGDWRDLPTAERLEACSPGAHNNKYRVLAFEEPSNTVIGATRPGSGAPSVGDPRTPPRFNNVFTVHPWTAPAGAVTGGHGPSSGGQSIADVRVASAYPHTYGVLAWGQPAHTVTGTTASPGQGPFSVGDPRVKQFGGGPYGVQSWDAPARTITGESWVTAGVFSVADGRLGYYRGTYGVTPWRDPLCTITGRAGASTGAFSIADPRLECSPRAGAYGVLDWSAPSPAVTGSARIDNGTVAVADPRVPGNPRLALRWYPRDLRSAPPFAPVLPTADGTWHRPLTTLELAALQGLPTVIDGRPLALAGTSTSSWREHIGNMVPPPAAWAIARQMLATLVQADAQAWALSGEGAVWVAPAEAAVVQ